ncbi:MAG: NAD(P)-binding protein [Hyphomicrobiales bacterium]
MAATGTPSASAPASAASPLQQLTKFRPGTRVLLIDKHSRPGGYATNFERPKQAARLDCSLHKLSGMGGEGNLRRILGGLGADEALSFIHPDHYFAAILPDRRIVLPNEAAATEAVLAEVFPTEREGLAQFFQDAASHGKDGYFQYQMLSGDYRPDMKALRAAHRTLKRVTVAEKLDGLFSSSELKNILAAPAVYVGAFPEEISYLYYLHVVYATLHAGNAYVLGSAQRLSDHLVERIVSAGGGINLSNPVRRVLSDGAGRATGVETLKGRYFSDRIFLNAAPHYALDHLFAADEALVPVRAKRS